MEQGKLWELVGVSRPRILVVNTVVNPFCHHARMHEHCCKLCSIIGCKSGAARVLGMNLVVVRDSYDMRPFAA